MKDDVEYEYNNFEFYICDITKKNFGKLPIPTPEHDILVMNKLVWIYCQVAIEKEIRDLAKFGWEPVIKVDLGNLWYDIGDSISWSKYILFGIITLGIGFFFPGRFRKTWRTPTKYKYLMRRPIVLHQ
jgi:hypothetical protein